MAKSRFRATSFAAPAIAIVAAVGVIAALAAWERTSVSVFEATPTESLLLLKAGDISDPTVDLGATNFDERTEKRIEGFGRAVLEYEFDAKETGVNVRTRIIERPTAELAAEEAADQLTAFDGAAQTAPVLVYGTLLFDEQAAEPEIRTRKGRTFFLARRGTYVYTLETTTNFASEYAVLALIAERMKQLDRRGAVLPLRVPLME